MRVLSRTIFREIATGAFFGVILFTFVLFLRNTPQLFAILVRSSAPPKTVAYLFSLVLPQALTFTVPLGVLVGVLLGLSRMSGDSEITALRASGIPGRIVTHPVLAAAALATCATFCCSLWLTPWSYREYYRIVNKLAAEQLTAEIQARVFDEQFPNRILYVGDVIPGTVVRWRNVFIADVTPPEQRPKTAREYTDTPRITVAASAIATPDIARNRIQLSIVNGSSYEKDAKEYSISFFPKGEQVLEAQKPNEIRATHPAVEMDMGPLYRLAYRDPAADRQRRLEAQIEFHQRLALPLACVLLALIGIPLGVSSRKGGKSGAFVLTVGVAFLYYLGLMSLIKLAQQGAVPVPLAVWTPDAILAMVGVALMARLEIPGDRDWIGRARAWMLSRLAAMRGRLSSAPRGGGVKFPLAPQILDAYVLNSFLFYLGVFLASFVLMFHVFTFFELLSDIIKNGIPMSQFLEYLFFLTPKLIYDFAPISVLVAVLITFGVFTKYNEVTAFKACGVSLYRLAVPILAASMFLSGGLFAFDHYYIPEANRRQDALRSIIKGHPAQTYYRPDRKWISGRGDRIYYYKYFDTAQQIMAGVSVFEIDKNSFRLTRQIQAERAHWEPALNKWIFENGWSADIDGVKVIKFDDFSGQTRTFAELNEPPSWFMKEVKQYFQMNFQALAAYIRELQQSGFNTIALQVQYHKKFSVPLFAVIMALISIPFSFVAGTRGAMAGVGVSFAIAIAYWSISMLFEQIGNLNQLPPEVAAWSPDALFTLTGLYFLMRMRT
ncbi:MAG TPA: LptF/LptG family permease [Bryobacteraceae bacterium]|jgi:LPS export ABC transporter permease LptG/LPS export ABC transporter permease LptF|nr:LptF/LptG family permease [Bryobacteraceae bacterium]